MTDFNHMKNIIQGAMLESKERGSPDEQIATLEKLENFLRNETTAIVLEKLRAKSLLDNITEYEEQNDG